MVAKISHPKNIHRAIYYNENKVVAKTAVCIRAGNFLKTPDQLNLVEKKQEFDRLIALNQTVKRHTLHVSLNFAPGEHLTREQLGRIAREYMEGIGFGDQPYLVYQHFDAGHPHVHIVSTNIRSDGSRIDMNYIGRDKSEPTRKAIEEKYGLVRAEDQRKRFKYELSHLSPQSLQYGKSETKRAITNLLQYVLDNYSYRSLPELNAILKLYNLRANAGLPGSRIHKHGGLIYQMLDEKGQGIGIPIKASSIFFNPGLSYLDKKFQANQVLPPDALQRIQYVIDAAIRSRPKSWAAFAKILRQEKIHAEPYINKEGFWYGLSFVDLECRLVVKASALDKAYALNNLLDQLGLQALNRREPDKHAHKKSKSNPGGRDNNNALSPELTRAQVQSQTQNDIEKLLDILLRPEEQARLPYELRAQKKKKKNQSRHL